jgi:hypothetical protein
VLCFRPHPIQNDLLDSVYIFGQHNAGLQPATEGLSDLGRCPRLANPSEAGCRPVL